MKTKKRGVYAALAVVLLITAALIASCLDAIDPSGLPVSKQENPNTPFVEGKGYLKLNIGGKGTGRTISPDTPNFTSYKVDVTSTGGDPSNDLTDVTLTVSGGTASVAIPQGNYNVFVRAFTTIGVNQVLAARGHENGVTVGASGGTSTIDLEAIPVDEAAAPNGLFKWSLTLPKILDPDPPYTDMIDNVDSAAITVTGYSSGTAVINGVSILDTGAINTAGTSLAPGYYKVTATLVKAKHLTHVFSEILHIYPGQTSTFTRTFPALAKNRYTVTYASVTGGADATDKIDDDNSTAGWLHDNTITELTSGVGHATAGYTLDGWYKDDSRTTGNTWNFGSERIIGDMTLYAKWNAPIGISVSISYDAPEIKELTITNATQNFTRAALTNQALVFEFTNADDFDNIHFEYNSASWDSYYDDTDKELTLTFSATGNMGSPFPAPAQYIITVLAEDNGDSIPYSGQIVINVIP